MKKIKNKNIVFKLLGLIVSLAITCVVLFVLLFVATVVLSNSGKNYPETANLTDIAIGNSETLTVDDMVLRFFDEETYDYKITAKLTELPQEVINAKYNKCGSIERTLICFLQGENNTMLSFVQENREGLTETTGTTGIDFVRLFGIDYIIVSCNTDSGHPAKLNDTFVVYKTDANILNDIEAFEGLSNYKSNYPIDYVNFLYMNTQNYYLFDLLWFFIGLLIFVILYRRIKTKLIRK